VTGGGLENKRQQYEKYPKQSGSRSYKWHVPKPAFQSVKKEFDLLKSPPKISNKEKTHPGND
jgi:hypothetical protein